MALCCKDPKPAQHHIRKWTSDIVDRQLIPSALRELRAEMTDRRAIVAMIGVGLILGLSGPFDTLRLLSFLPRVAYWLTVVVASYGIGSLISTLANGIFCGKPLWLHLMCSSLAIGLAVALLLVGLNWVTFGYLPETVPAFLTHWMFVTAISAVIEVGAKLAFVPQTEQKPPLLDRLPFAKRGALVALSAEDHYVNIHTTLGSELLLMRLSDAIKEAAPAQGLQIHRSHWVAMDQIKDVRRIADRGEVVLLTGETRPISRGYMPAVRDAGLLPNVRNNG